MGDTQRSHIVSTKLQEIAEQARQHPEMVFTSLIYLMDIDFLREAYRLTHKDGAKGVDQISGRDYGEDLEENLQSLHSRLRQQRYKAMPV